MPSPDHLRELAEATEPRMQIVAPFFVLPCPDVTQVLLIRHAQVPEGSTVEDSGLTSVGQEQAQALTDCLASTRIDGVYSSPSQRARQTAELLAETHGLDVQVIDALRDVDNHLPHGLSISEAMVREFGEDEANRRLEQLRQHSLKFDVLGSLMESSDSLRQRAVAAIDRAVGEHPGGRVVIVSHGPTIAAYISDVVRSPDDFVFYPRLTSITIVLAQGEKRQLQLLNAMPHFGVL
jgi:broad specificity phosphatase PhoE